MSTTITPKEFDFIWFYKIKQQKRPNGNPATKNKTVYKDIVTAFDIETTRITEIEQSVMYIWQWQFGDKYTVIGRTWKEFTDFCIQLRNVMQPNEYLCTYVHNLSYEFQFLRGIYDFSIEEVFAIKSRKVLKCDMHQHFEFRCSYLHSNMSLAEYTYKMGAEHVKLSGSEFDYKILRYPWTTLTNKEIEYCTHDVLGLVEAITIEMNFDKDSLYTIPITSTGYVRRDAKKAMREVSHTYIRNQLLDFHTYKMCKEGFRGGNTHANRFYSGYILKNVKSADRSSSYPEVQCNCKFPTSKFFNVGQVTFDELLDLINVRGKAVIMRVSITDIKLINEFWGAPYLSRDKCRNIRNAVFDNGRILSADYLETTITDIDFKIILSEYKFADLCPFDVAHARYGYLPPSLIKATIEYYIGKTSLKGVDGEEMYYMKSKNKLNSIYGMMAQDPVKQSIDYLNDEKDLFVEQEEDEQELLNETNSRAFLCYQWGVWVTAWSRYALEEGIKLAGDNFVYCDTDSVKYIGVIDFTEYNKSRIADSLKSGAYATDPSGEVHYMGVFEQEHDMIEFITLGAKKYCYKETETSPLVTTIAGVNKKKGGIELEKAGGIKEFKKDFIFVEAGGTESVYNDNPTIDYYEIDGHRLPITSNVVIKDSTYKLGLTAEYERLLLDSNFYVDNQ